MEVSAQILADGIDMTQADQGCDILKQYIDTFVGPVLGFQLNVATAAYDVTSNVSAFESPGRPWETIAFKTAINTPRPPQRAVQYDRITGSRNIKDTYEVLIPSPEEV